MQGSPAKVLIIGLGQIGYSNAEYMTSLGLNVDGYDISQASVDRALEHKIIQNQAKDFSGYDYYVVCISTHNPNDMFRPYLDGIFDIAKKISSEGKRGAVVGIDSTITKGTSKKVLEILKHRQHVVHVPHRFYIYEKEDHGVNQMRVMGGCEKCCVDAGKSFYEGILKIPLHEVSAIEVAELTKIVENSYRYLEIAFAEELKMICDDQEVSFDELRAAVNTKWNIKILEAKDGIGGHCLPKDSDMFLSFAKNSIGSSILQTAKMMDLKYRLHVKKRPLLETVETGSAASPTEHEMQ